MTTGTPGAPRLANVIHSSEYPRSTFLILDTLLCLVAENSLDTIFSHLKQFYPPRKQPKIEVKGKVYLVKQYAVKFGAISMGSVNKGIVVEVRYAPVHVCVAKGITVPPSQLYSNP